MLTTIPVRDVATDFHHTMLGQARTLSHALYEHAVSQGVKDDTTLLAADLLDAHADTGIELQTWPAALATVTDQIVLTEAGCDLLRCAGQHTWFTIIGTWRGNRRVVLATMPGRHNADLTVRCWLAHVHASTLPDAVAAAQLDGDLPLIDADHVILKTEQV